jgi:two-component system, NarL family, nitrate/nitrite response regulator NarL
MPGNGTLLSPQPELESPVLVFLICRVRLYHDAIIGLLNQQPGITAVGAADIGGDLMSDLDAAGPDVVLLDIGNPDALALAGCVVRARPQTRILGLGVDDVPSQVVACAEAGLCGYVPNHASIAELAQAARRVAAGDTVCSAEMARKLFDHLRSVALGGSPSAIDAVLTSRQQQILRLIREGLSNKQIAQRLSLGTSTVKNHVHSLLGRLQVGRRAEAAARINRAGQME